MGPIVIDIDIDAMMSPWANSLPGPGAQPEGSPDGWLRLESGGGPLCCRSGPDSYTSVTSGHRRLASLLAKEAQTP